MIFEIPGNDTIEIENVVLDYNGTIAIDGKLIEGVAALINELSGKLNFHVLTADTFGSVERELASVNCKVVVIPKDKQDAAKLDYVLGLGKDKTLCVGNGRNDRLMMKEAVISIAVIQDEGVSVESLLAADIACHSIIDVFAYFKSPNRLKATLRN
ncbi:HAD family hydrolase [Sunxiuqinia sp. A32]|uniref:HAD family hydrolase n=1 Tax=Sunxiuqinia sp. A32 TaxID=3461496 RepID=UPI0040461262